MRHSQPLQFQKTCFDSWVKIRIYVRHFWIKNNSFQRLNANGNGINNIDLQLIDRHQSTFLCCTNQELCLPAYGVSQKNNDIGLAFFFLPSTSPLSFFRPCTYPKGCYFYSPQSFTVMKLKISKIYLFLVKNVLFTPVLVLKLKLWFTHYISITCTNLCGNISAVYAKTSCKNVETLWWKTSLSYFKSLLVSLMCAI